MGVGVGTKLRNAVCLLLYFIVDNKIFLLSIRLRDRCL